MGLFTKLTFLGLAFSIGMLAIAINNILKVPPVPKLEDTWWGPGKPSAGDTSIKPFKIQASKEVLKDLQQRLENARPFAPPLEGVAQEYGMNTKLLKNIVEFWKTKYNWEEREKFLNKYPQFTTKIQGLDVHFLHVKPSKVSGVQVLPLLMLHGWPGSVREFYEIIPLLTTPQKGYNFVFEVIVPSLPGYGFSQAASKPGLGAVEMSLVFKNLMKRLGFEKFYVQGGDWGALIVTHMATLFPQNILGMHSNLCYANTPLSNFKIMVGTVFPSLIVDQKYEDRMYPLSKIASHIMLETGYMHLQATKPDTIGTALNQSPVGLAAYILEKFTSWTNPEWKTKPNGGLTEKFTYNDLLDNVMIYWITGSITSSMRLYSESFNKRQMSMWMEMIPTEVPSACARFRHELVHDPDSLIKEKYVNLVQSTDYDIGGHFIAFEEPKVLSADIWSGINKMEMLRKKPQ